MSARHVIGPWVAAACLAMMLAGAGNLDNLSPTDAQAEWDQSTALQDAIKTEAAEARFTRAARQICGDNAGYTLVDNDRTIVCTTKRGHVTRRVAL